MNCGKIENNGIYNTNQMYPGNTNSGSDAANLQDIGKILGSSANYTGLNFDDLSANTELNFDKTSNQWDINFINNLKEINNELKNYTNNGYTNTDNTSSSDIYNSDNNLYKSLLYSNNINSSFGMYFEWLYLQSLLNSMNNDSNSENTSNTSGNTSYTDSLINSSFFYPSSSTTSSNISDYTSYVKAGSSFFCPSSSTSSSSSSYTPYTGSTTSGTYSSSQSASSSSSYASNTKYSSASGKVETQLDFENGKYPDVLPETKEPAKIMTDANGNKFLRFTANYGDQQAIPSQYKDRVRATMYMAGGHWTMPEVNNSNKSMSYSADIRFIDDKTRKGYYNNSFFELFQGSDKYKSNGYGASDSPSGPPVKFIRKDNGHVCLQTTQDNGDGKLKCKQYDLGYFASGEFHNFRLDATWDKQNGGYKVYVDGKEKLDLKGICTYYNPKKSNLVPAMKCGLYGGNAVGSVDVDNVKIVNTSK